MSNFDSVSISSSRELVTGREETGVETFLRSTVYSGVQVPLSGAAQLIDKVAGSNILPKLQFIEAPKQDSMAANLGAITASAGHCALMITAGHKIVGPVNDLSSFGQRALVAGGIGAIYGGVFTPVLGDSNFAANRLQNMAAGTAGLAGMSAFSSLYQDVLAKGVSFADAPFYKGLLMPGSLAGVATMADTQLFPRENNSVFLPGAKLRPAEQFYLKPVSKH